MTDQHRFLPATYSRLLTRLIVAENPARAEQRKDRLFSGTSLNAMEIEFDKCQVKVSDQYQVISNALELSKKPGLGLRLGTTVDLSSHGVLGIAALTSSTLCDVFKTLAHYYVVRIPIIELQLVTSDTGITLRIRNRGTLPNAIDRFLIEAYAAMFQNITESIIGRHATDYSVTLPFDDSDNTELYKEFFHGTVNIQSQPFAELHFPLHLAHHPCSSGDALIHRQAEMGCHQLLDQIQRQQSITEKVEHMLNMENGTLLNLEEIASVLHISKRTLIRKLKREGTSFQVLAEHRLQELSIHYLAQPDLSVEAVAHILGYAYVANFRRAFKRWFGVSPRTYRQKTFNS